MTTTKSVWGITWSIGGQQFYAQADSAIEAQQEARGRLARQGQPGDAAFVSRNGQRRYAYVLDHRGIVQKTQ